MNGGGGICALSICSHKSSPTYRKPDIMDTVRRFCSGDRGINLNYSKANITNEKKMSISSRAGGS